MKKFLKQHLAVQTEKNLQICRKAELLQVAQQTTEIFIHQNPYDFKCYLTLPVSQE